MNPSTALGLISDLTAATDLFGAVRHIRQAATASVIRGHATTVVNDVDSQHVGNVDFDSQS